MNKRIVFLDYVRVVACFLVMLVHSSEVFYGAETPSGLVGYHSYLANESNRLWVAIFDGGSRICVPLFMIVSAFLLAPMKEDQTMGGFYRKRLRRILPPLVFFLLLYTFLPLAWGGMTWEQSLADLKHLPWNFPSMAGHLWFMYPLIGLYLIIPVVSPWLRQASAKDERIFIGLFAFSTFIPFIRRFISEEIWGEAFWNGFHTFWYVSGYLGYLVLAHYIRTHLEWDRAKRIRIGVPCLLAGSLFSIWAFWTKAVPGVLIDTPTVEWAWEFCTPNVLLATFGAFLLFTCIRKEESPALVRDVSGLTYGMYLMHMFFLTFWSGVLIGQGSVAAPAVPVYLAIPLTAILTYVSAALTTKLISFLPGSEWLVGVSSRKTKA